MPKVVDPVQRGRQVADAFVRVVRREGLAAASVRTVAAEAGLSAGALRHYFDSQSGLVAYVFESLMTAAVPRIMAALTVANDVDSLAVALEQVIPLDDERVAEYEAWFALVNEARTDPALQPLSLQAHRDIRRLCRTVVDRLLPSQTRDGLRDEAAADLHALLDGLALHLTLYPDDSSRHGARAGIRRALHTLAPAAGWPPQGRQRR